MIKKKGYPILLVVLFVFMGSMAFSQELWFETAEEVSFKEDFSVKFEQQLRLKDQATEWRAAMGQLSLAYDVTKHFQVRGNFRYAYIHRKDSEYRFAGDLRYSRNLGKSDWKATYRMRLQFDQQVDGEDQQSGLRNRIELKYKLHDKAKPFISGELFHVWEPRLFANRYRVTAGFANQVLKVFKLETYVRYERELNASELDFGNLPQEASILGFSLKYEF